MESLIYVDAPIDAIFEKDSPSTITPTLFS